MKRHRTPYGTVTTNPDVPGAGFSVTATARQLWEWAHRPGSWWPCSDLAQLPRGIGAGFDSGGNLVELWRTGSRDVAGHEFNAWVSDVLESAGIPNPHAPA